MVGVPLNVPVAALVLVCARACRRRGTPTPVAPSTSPAGDRRRHAGVGDVGLTTVGERGWSDGSVIATAALAVVGAVVFVRRMATAPDPLVPPPLFRSREFTVTNLATALLYAGLGVSFFLVAYGLQVAGGWSATHARVALLPATVLMLVFSSRSAALPSASDRGCNSPSARSWPPPGCSCCCVSVATPPGHATCCPAPSCSGSDWSRSSRR